jgi:magnesium transporter
MMERLKRMLIFRAYEEDMELLEDVLIENLQAIEMTNISQNILAQMTEAYSSIINNNMNNVIKFLTLVTICISLPTLISSFYGMNISLPGQDSDKAFFAIIAISVGMVLATILFFRKKRWF